MRNYRTLDELEEDYFRKHPEEIGIYLTEIFEEFAQDGDAAALLASLRIVARVQGITVIANKTGMTRQGLQKALSEKGNPSSLSERGGNFEKTHNSGKLKE